MLSAQQLARVLLPYIGVTQFSAQESGSNQSSYDAASDGPALLAAINGALQEIYATAPHYLSHRPRALTVPAPLRVTLSATQNSAVISAATPSTAFVPGCMIVIDGDPLENEVVSTTALLHPFVGSTGSVSATIYGDCIALSGIAAVNPPVELVGYRYLSPAGNYSEFQGFDRAFLGGYTNYGGSVAASARRHVIAQPLGYYVDTLFDSVTGALSSILRLSPVPDARYVVRFEASLLPVQITADDLGTDAADPNKYFGLSNGWDESVLLPMALQRWTSHPSFKNEAAKAEIARQFKTASTILSAARPQGVSGQRVHVGCF